MHDLKSRSISFIISIALITVLLLFSKTILFAIIFLVVLALVISIALWEFYKMAEKKGAKPLYTLGIIGTICYLVAVFFSIFFVGWTLVPQLILGALFFLLFFQNLIRIRAPLTSIAVSYFGIFYVVVSLAFIMKINFFYPVGAPISGQWWLLYLLVVTKSTDFAAYFCGKFLGRNALAPLISPKKTIEGLIGGIACSILASFLLVFLTPHVYQELRTPWAFALIMALILSIFGQFGDLTESLIKRDAGVKDSNRIKGSGGILDMVDSMIFTSPIFYLFLKYGTAL